MSDQYQSRQERRKSLSKNKKGKKKRSLFKKILLFFSLFVLAAIIAGGIAVAMIIHNAPKLNPAALSSPLTTVIYDKNDQPVAKLYDKQNRSKIDIKNVPKLMKEAVISTEDRRFYHHFGIDILRIFGAALSDIKKGSLSEGASTITQQVIKRSFLSPQKTFTRKIQEAYLAVNLEQKYSKDQILEMYLNKIYYGNNAYGIATASQVYFGKQLKDLNLSQMALLAGIPNAPTAYDPYKHPKKAAERRNQVLDAMVETGDITPEQAKKAKAKKVTSLVKKQQETEDPAKSYKAFVDTVYHELVEQRHVISEKEFYTSGLKIYTTLDTEAQKEIHHLLKSDEISYPDDDFETGMALLDTKTGAVRAIGGGRHFLSVGYTNYGSQVHNAPGSTMKPVADYAPAIEYLKWSTYHPITDASYSYKDGTPIHDWDGKYLGEMTLRNALAESRNIPALKTFYAVGKDKVTSFAEKLGMTFENKPIPDATAIGSFNPGATPLQMAGSYAAFGNKGVYHKPYTVRKIVFPDGKTIQLDHESHVAMHDYTAYMTNSMLKSVIDYGTGIRANIPGLPVAGKTGSVGLDSDFKEENGIHDSGALSDEWFTGYTTQYTLSIWTGYPSLKTKKDGKTELHYIQGDSPAKYIARDLFKKVMGDISGDNVPDFEKPDSVVSVTLEKDTGKRASKYTPDDDKITELFVKGYEPTKVSDKYQKLLAPSDVNAGYDQDNDQIHVTWSYGNGRNVSFEIEQAVDNGELQRVDTTEDKQFSVQHPKSGSTYHFKIYAVDKDTGTKSDPGETEVSIPKEQENQAPESPRNVRAVYNQENHQIVITWSGSGGGQQGPVVYKIEQAKNNGPFQPIHQTPNTQLVISNVDPDTLYRFQLIAVNIENGKSSGPVTTKVKTPKMNQGGGNQGSNGSGNDDRDQGDNGSGNDDGGQGDNGTGNDSGGQGGDNGLGNDSGGQEGDGPGNDGDVPSLPVVPDQNISNHSKIHHRRES